MLIHDVAKRKEASANRMLLLLNFLKEETYSDFKTLKKATGFKGKNHESIYRLLNKAIFMGFIIKHEYPVLTGKKSLWGITMQGLAMVVTADDAVFPGYFEPTKLRYWVLEHHLLNQRVRLSLEAKGGSLWVNGDRSGFLARYPGVKHKPDGVVTMDNGAVIAVETERSMKTRARYINIINSHLEASDAGHWHYAMYVMPDEKSKQSLMKLFDGIKTVIRNNIPVPFDAKNREMFLFRTVDELEQVAANGN